MSLHQIGSDAKYILPASYNSVPVALQSNKSAKPIPCQLNTVTVPSLSGSQSASGTVNFQIPMGSSAGFIGNAYLKFAVKLSTSGATADVTAGFKQSQGCATSLINRYSLFVNSVLIDNIQNCDVVYNDLFAHSTSYDWLSHDAVTLMGRGDISAFTVSNKAVESNTKTFVIPLLGVLGSQQYFPSALCQGVMNVNIDLNSFARSFFCSAIANLPGANYTVSNAQLVYDRITPEQSFIDQVKAEMAMGQKFVYGYTNYQSSTQAVGTGAGTFTINLGLNVSSLRGVLMSKITNSNFTDATKSGFSFADTLNNFQVTLDGRQINNCLLDAVSAPAVVFAEMNRALGRIFDASITDSSSTLGQNDYDAKNQGSDKYLSGCFLAGVSAQRSNEGLAYSGSPVSVLGVQSGYSNASGFASPAEASTQFYTLISDYQLLIDGQSVEILR